MRGDVKRWGRLALALIPLCAAYAHGITIELFQNTPSWGPLPVSDYRSLIRNLSAGDMIQFSDDVLYTFREYLGHGNTSFILAIAEHDDWVLRVPLTSGKLVPNSSAQLAVKAPEYIEQIALGAPLLEHLEITHANVWRRSYRRNERILQRRVRNPQTFRQVILQQKEGFTEKQLYELGVWSQQAAPLLNLGDFSADQLAWEPERERWVLLDWSYGGRVYIPGETSELRRKQSVFHSWFYVHEGLHPDFTGIVFDGEQWTFTSDYLSYKNANLKAFGADHAFWSVERMDERMDHYTHAQMESLRFAMNMVQENTDFVRRSLAWSDEELLELVKLTGKDAAWLAEHRSRIAHGHSVFPKLAKGCMAILSSLRLSAPSR